LAAEERKGAKSDTSEETILGDPMAGVEEINHESDDPTGIKKWLTAQIPKIDSEREEYIRLLKLEKKNREETPLKSVKCADWVKGRRRSAPKDARKRAPSLAIKALRQTHEVKVSKETFYKRREKTTSMQYSQNESGEFKLVLDTFNKRKNVVWLDKAGCIDYLLKLHMPDGPTGLHRSRDDMRTERALQSPVRFRDSQSLVDKTSAACLFCGPSGRSNVKLLSRTHTSWTAPGTLLVIDTMEVTYEPFFINSTDE